MIRDWNFVYRTDSLVSENRHMLAHITNNGLTAPSWGEEMTIIDEADSMFERRYSDCQKGK
ncbi:MAG: hypothetical protein KGL39_58455 [Patescibacteria group bacterium]|nr:hypothetical protein [Patescibacteria group bacterium]